MMHRQSQLLALKGRSVDKLMKGNLVDIVDAVPTHVGCIEASKSSSRCRRQVQRPKHLPPVLLIVEVSRDTLHRQRPLSAQSTSPALAGPAPAPAGLGRGA